MIELKWSDGLSWLGVFSFLVVAERVTSSHSWGKAIAIGAICASVVTVLMVVHRNNRAI
jgi:hypothetical protein